MAFANIDFSKGDFDVQVNSQLSKLWGGGDSSSLAWKNVTLSSGITGSINVAPILNGLLIAVSGQINKNGGFDNGENLGSVKGTALEGVAWKDWAVVTSTTGGAYLQTDGSNILHLNVTSKPGQMNVAVVIVK